MDLERDLDGMVGRMLSWLTLAPTRACGERAEALPLARGAESDGAAAEFAQRLRALYKSSSSRTGRST